jgi:hypothetical protein
MHRNYEQMNWVHILGKNGAIFWAKSPIFCYGYLQNDKLTPAPSEIASQFAPKLRLHSNNT